MIRLDDISKKTRGKTILRNLNFEFRESLGVYGGNGVGKTTLLKILALIESPSRGDILQDGNSILKNPEQHQKRIGYLPQKFDGFQNVSVYKNLVYFSKAKGVKGYKKRQEKIEMLMKDLNISKYRNVKLKNLSGGVLRRVGIAQALLNNPKILILDEPTTGLDFKEQVKIRTLLNELKNSGVKIIVCSHLIDDLLVLSDEIISLNEGQITSVIKVKEILNANHLLSDIYMNLDSLKENVETSNVISFIQEEKDVYRVKKHCINGDDARECTDQEKALIMLNNEGLS